MQTYLTGHNLLIAVLFIVAVCWACNMVFSTVQNVRKIKDESQEPIVKLTARIEGVERMLANDKNRMDNHEQMLSNM